MTERKETYRQPRCVCPSSTNNTINGTGNNRILQTNNNHNNRASVPSLIPPLQPMDISSNFNNKKPPKPQPKRSPKPISHRQVRGLFVTTKVIMVGNKTIPVGTPGRIQYSQVIGSSQVVAVFGAPYDGFECQIKDNQCAFGVLSLYTHSYLSLSIAMS